MRQLYVDTASHREAIALFVNEPGTEIIPAGTAVCSMSPKDRNEEYRTYADQYDLHFIFDDAVPAVDFYAVPRVELFACDSGGGLFGTIIGSPDLEEETPVCYISPERKPYRAAGSLRELLEIVKGPGSWKSQLTADGLVTLYASREDAAEKLEFFTFPE